MLDYGRVLVLSFRVIMAGMLFKSVKATCYDLAFWSLFNSGAVANVKNGNWLFYTWQ